MRERDWCNVITAHDGDTRAYTWRLQHFTLGEAVLVPPAGELQGAPAAPVTSVAISGCGNFGLVGSASGRIDRYNMQSGAYRGSYKRPGGARPPPPLRLPRAGPDPACVRASARARACACSSRAPRMMSCSINW